MGHEGADEGIADLVNITNCPLQFLGPLPLGAVMLTRRRVGHCPPHAVRSSQLSPPGGDVLAGLSMYNGLRSSGLRVNSKAMGLVASAAALPFLAGDVRIMPSNTLLMVHNPASLVYGNANEMREAAEILDEIARSVGATCAARTACQMPR